MAFEPRIDEMPLASAGQKIRHEKTKWLVLIATFLLVLLIGLIVVWTRPAIYQSSALIHFSYPDQVDRTFIPIEQLAINQQRLTSHRSLEQVQEYVLSELGIVLNIQELAEILATEVQVENKLIIVKAKGADPIVLEPVLSALLDVYFTELSSENSSDNAEELERMRGQLTSLDMKIAEERQNLADFSHTNNIVSLERNENRVLNKLNSLTASIDMAETKETEAEVTLSKIEAAAKNGIVLTHPNDEADISITSSLIGQLTSTLDDIAQRYTEEYMNLDPVIVDKKRKLEQTKQKKLDQISRSHRKYISESKRNIALEKEKRERFAEQLAILSMEAKEFNQKLDQSTRKTTSLKQLEAQAQQLKDKLIKIEVQRPLQPQIKVLEHPFAPTYPISPNYWLNSAIVACLAALSGLLALFIYSFIVRPERPDTSFTTYNLVPNAVLGNQSLAPNSPHLLSAEQKPDQALHLHHARLEKPSRLLSIAECQTLFSKANTQGKITVGLMLCGVNVGELLTLKCSDFDATSASIRIEGSYSRSVRLPQPMLTFLSDYLDNQTGDTSFWKSELMIEDFKQILVNLAYDCGIEFPEQLTTECLRHTYLNFLVSQGLKLNDLESIAGYVSPDDLARYRPLIQQNNVIQNAQPKALFFPIFHSC